MPDDTLTQLADLHGVATSYTDATGRRVDVPAATVRAVLAAMDVPAAADEAADALDRARAAARRRLPHTIVARHGHPTSFEVPALRDAAKVEVQLEEGGARGLPAGQALPADLPTGYHRLAVDDEEAFLVVAPGRCPLAGLADPERGGARRVWGWMAQLYAVRSADSWAIGDLGDLRRLAAWSAAELGAGMVLVNPLHAATPVVPVEPSPYYPSSRRFRNPLYLRVEDVAALQGVDTATRERVAGLAAPLQAANRSDRIDRDGAFRAKMTALELLFALPRAPAREAAFATYRAQQGQGLVDFATFCALAERHGTPYTQWPTALRHPASPAVTEARGELADRVALHEWLQWLCDTQLAAAQGAALDAGMAVGIVHDLAVGVDGGGADAWALQDDLAAAVTVGAPPDTFNQQGQDWRLPPLRPDRLALTGYAPFRDMIGGVLRHAGGIRVDHVLGLFRLYWIPEGAPASAGTYVRYPGDDLLGVLALEAERAGALVVGEDLGTVGEGVRERLTDAGVLGSRVLYFERSPDGAGPLPATGYPELALASVTTHDLPTAAGWWTGEAERVRAEFDLFGEDTTQREEEARAARARAELAALLLLEGLVSEEAGVEELIVGMHAFLARTPSLVVAASLGDALGDIRQPNLPGTTDEYPNWRLPLAVPTEAGLRPVLLEEIFAHPGVRRLAAVLHRA
ncbi:MAG TPA: 4-alpha-glucanotransferase [Egibacteraceae bacterium]|nr:4-alpha-glucanotransferase [Egibacteraceae bacterium]